MKNYIFFLLCLASFIAKAQYVTIPDAAFRAKLQSIYPACFNGQGQMDTTCTPIVTDSVMTETFGGNIQDLSGIRYFDNLKWLDCRYNQITSLPVLPAGLKYLSIQNNQLTTVSNLPNNLKGFYCASNNITNIVSLPNSLQYLDCSMNQLTSLPTLPTQLVSLTCLSNQLSTFPTLPSNLLALYCGNNQFTSLPVFPSSLDTLECSYNQLTDLSSLTIHTAYFSCSYNQITQLPNFGNDLYYLACDNNHLSSLPQLPASLTTLMANDNLLLMCLPILSDNLSGLAINNTGITCIPNTTNFSSSWGLPVCSNPNQVCATGAYIQAKAYQDIDANNVYNAGDSLIPNILIHSDVKDIYTLSDNTNGYLAYLESGVPNTITAINPYPNLVTITPTTYTVTPTISSGAVSGNYDFKVDILANIQDLTVSMVAGIARPGFNTTIWVKAKNIGSVNINNASVSLTIPNWVLVSSNPLYSSYNSNVITWDNISLTMFEEKTFVVTLNVPATTPLGTGFSYLADIHPTANDIDTYNNYFTWLDTVRGSFDPNDKKVSAEYLLPNYDANKDLFYTIRFQNTGTDTAFTVIVRDELDASKLNLSSFRLLGASHQVKTKFINQSTLQFQFDNILLPDSNVNEAASHGYIQFAIKPQAGLLLGDEIPNFADIFFDFNAPVRTNTATTKIVNIIQNQPPTPNFKVLSIYPNPTTNGSVQIEYHSEKDATLYWYDALGKRIATHQLENEGRFSYQFPSISDNFYFYQLMVGDKLVSQGKVILGAEK